MKLTYHIIDSENSFQLVRVLSINEHVCYDVVGTFKDIELAEDAIPANSAQSGNFAGVTPGDEPVIRKRKRRRFQRVLRRLAPR